MLKMYSDAAALRAEGVRVLVTARMKNVYFQKTKLEECQGYYRGADPGSSGAEGGTAGCDFRRRRKYYEYVQGGAAVSSGLKKYKKVPFIQVTCQRNYLRYEAVKFLKKTKSSTDPKTGAAILRYASYFRFRNRSAVLWPICSNCSSVRFSSRKRFVSTTGSHRG